MSDSSNKGLAIAAVGFILGLVAMKVYMSSESKEKKEEENEEVKVAESPSLMPRTSTITKADYSKKFDKLKAASRLFTESLMSHGKINISRVPHLAETHDIQIYQSPMLGDISKRDILGFSVSGFLPEEAFSSSKKFVLAGQSYQSYKDIADELKFLRAGPRKQIVFNPEEVKAAIVTCGGLCPGLNVVIREIVMALWYNYGVREIYGVKNGF